MNTKNEFVNDPNIKYDIRGSPHSTAALTDVLDGIKNNEYLYIISEYDKK